MANIMTGIQIARAITDVLNDICRSEGGIQRDDARIWAEWMHKMTEDDWADLASALDALLTVSPGSFRDYHVTNLKQAQQDIARCLALGKSYVGVPLVARSGNKTSAWRLIMTMREVVNDYNGVVIANRPQDTAPTAKSADANTFSDLFV